MKGSYCVWVLRIGFGFGCEWLSGALTRIYCAKTSIRLHIKLVTSSMRCPQSRTDSGKSQEIALEDSGSTNQQRTYSVAAKVIGNIYKYTKPGLTIRGEFRIGR